jgi:DNA topoisomerase-1
MELIIVESPTKARTIGKFLGKEYEVESSFGHVRDLPKSKLGIDVAHDFAPHYVIPKKAKPVVKNLIDKAAKSSAVILATDEDREGEAIAWHLVQALGLNKQSEKFSAEGGSAPGGEFHPNDANKKQKKDNSEYSDAFARPPEFASGKVGQVDSDRVQRIAFHEITKNAIEEALRNPREIDLNLVDAQQARRVLDRLVGYELSPFLWRKIRYGLSAGRVQSVALRLVVEREREIQNFKREEYWSIEGEFAKNKKGGAFRAWLVSVDGRTLGKMDIRSETEAKKILAELAGANYIINSISKKNVVRNPSPPFTTSTLQQEAARKLGFSAKQTMVIAQQLYENGHITYMRTDSVNFSTAAAAQAQSVIKETFGEKYALPSPRVYAVKSKGAQEAHEAIRPTDLARLPDALSRQAIGGQAKKSGEELGLADRGQKKLYDLIWKRTVASQMQAAEMEQTSIDIKADKNDCVFRATGQIVKFDGFIRVYTEGKDEANGDEYEGTLPELKDGDKLIAKEILPLRHFTEPPPRYTDATLVKTLEANGIGRPSTYAPTLSTIQTRDYVEKMEKKYHPTEIGFLVNDLLVNNFPEIVDINFTSHIEEELDEIAEGKIGWTSVIKEFYIPFKKNLDAKEEEVKKHVEISTTPCPHCGKMMLVKFGRMGKFLACPDPESKVTLPLPEEAAKIKELEEKTKGERCPICGKPMEVKRSRFGYFLGCVDYPKCKGVKKILNKTGFKCPICLASPERKDNPGDIVEKKSRGRGRIFYACSRYPECDFTMNKKPESEDDVQAALENQKRSKMTKSGSK